jgi:hypothetical protein
MSEKYSVPTSLSQLSFQGQAPQALKDSVFLSVPQQTEHTILHARPKVTQQPEQKHP